MDLRGNVRFGPVNKSPLNCQRVGTVPHIFSGRNAHRLEILISSTSLAGQPIKIHVVFAHSIDNKQTIGLCPCCKRSQVPGVDFQQKFHSTRKWGNKTSNRIYGVRTGHWLWVRLQWNLIWRHYRTTRTSSTKRFDPFCVQKKTKTWKTVTQKDNGQNKKTQCPQHPWQDSGQRRPLQADHSTNLNQRSWLTRRC